MSTSFELVRRLGALALTIKALEFTAGQCARELQALIESDLCRDSSAAASSPPVEQVVAGRFVVDRATFSIIDGTQVCELGNTVWFRMIWCLASAPNRFFTRIELLAAVWEGQRRSPATIRSAVFELRAKLRDAKMHELANAIQATGRAYGLRFARPTRASERKTNTQSNVKRTPK